MIIGEMIQDTSVCVFFAFWVHLNNAMIIMITVIFWSEWPRWYIQFIQLHLYPKQTLPWHQQSQVILNSVLWDVHWCLNIHTCSYVRCRGSSASFLCVSFQLVYKQKSVRKSKKSLSHLPTGITGTGAAEKSEGEKSLFLLTQKHAFLYLF